MDQKNPGEIRGKSLQAMTTQELEELLRQEQDAEGMPDVERIEAILAVLDARGEAPDVDVDAAWDDFQNNYSFEAPLYPVPDEILDRADPQADASKQSFASRPAKRKRLFRAAIAVAAVLVLLLGLTLSVSAAGFKLWDALVQWTSETFGLRFSGSVDETPDVNPELADLYRTVLNIDSQLQIVPRYLPDGYTCAELASNDMQIVARFEKGDYCIHIQYLRIRRDNGEQFERDAGSAEEYVAGGITHYVSTNHGRIYAVWINNKWECSILDAPSKEELLRMIDSIYSED